MRRRDLHTADLFALPQVPQPATAAPGTMDFRAAVSIELSAMIADSGMDRYEISSRASRLTGRTISKAMLDGYTAESREEFNVCLALVPVLEEVCRSTRLSSWLAVQRGGQLLVGRDALAAELGRIEEQEQGLKERKAQLRDVLRRSRP